MIHSIQSFSDFVLLIYIKRKSILLFTLVLVILSAVSSFLIPEKFQSSALLYPYNYYSFDPRSIFENKKTFGNKEDIERIQQIAAGNSLLLYLNTRFSLSVEYKLEPSDPYYFEKLRNAFFAQFETIKNSSGGVEIVYTHSNPDTAAALINTSIAFIDSLHQASFVQNYTGLYNNLLFTLSEKEQLLSTLLADNSGDVIIRNQIASKQLETIELKSQLQSVNNILQHPPQSILVMEKARPNYKKVYPKRLFIIGGTTVVGLLSYILYLYLQLVYKHEIASRLNALS